MKTIIFVTHSKKEGLKSIAQLVDHIKATERAHYNLFFKFLMSDTYYISKGEYDEKGDKHFIGNNEVIFVPLRRLSSVVSKCEDKQIVLEKNCMVLSGDGEKAKRSRELIISWLLEELEEVKL